MAFAVDGPRGPYWEVKPGALLAARRAGGVMVPMGSAVHRGKTFARAWDRFELAWPFTRVTVVLGPPLPPPAADPTTPGAAERGLAVAIHTANERARGMLAGLEPKMLPYQGFLDAAHPVRNVLERN